MRRIFASAGNRVLTNRSGWAYTGNRTAAVYIASRSDTTSGCVSGNLNSGQQRAAYSRRRRSRNPAGRAWRREMDHIIVLATSNANKLKEIKELLRDFPV